jgi:hypothetical protein
MSEVGVTQTLVIGHLWQSVALAAVLALVLILGKRMRGATRYGLGVAAFMASLALPLAAFIPGETIVAGLLKQLDAPIALQPVETTRMEVDATGSMAAPVAPVEGVTPVLFTGDADALHVAPSSRPLCRLRLSSPSPPKLSRSRCSRCRNSNCPTLACPSSPYGLASPLSFCSAPAVISSLSSAWSPAPVRLTFRKRCRPA